MAETRSSEGVMIILYQNYTPLYVYKPTTSMNIFKENWNENVILCGPSAEGLIQEALMKR